MVSIGTTEDAATGGETPPGACLNLRTGALTPRCSSFLCSVASARCWSDLTAPSLFPRIVAASPFEKPKTNFSVSTCCCSVDRSSISSSIDLYPIDSSAPASAEVDSSISGSGTSSSGCQRRDARKWSIARLCAIRNSQAENGAARQRNLPIVSSILRNVCVVRSSAS